MSFSEVSAFLKSLQGSMHDEYWSNFASSIALAVVKITSAYEEFEKLGLQIDRKKFKKYFNIDEYKSCGFYGKSIMSATKSSESLYVFKEFLKLAFELDKNSALFIYDLYQAHKLSSEVEELIKQSKKIEKTIEECKPVLKKFEDLDPERHDDQKSRILQNYFQCTLSYSDIGLNDMLNHDDKDIPSLLEEGKIVVVNLQSFNEVALSHITDSTLVGRKKARWSYMTKVSMKRD